MHPIFLDLSKLELFGLSFNTPVARGIGLAVLVGVAMLLSLLWDKRLKSRSDRRWLADPLCLVILLGWAVVAFGVVWIVGRVFSYGLAVALGFILATVFARRRFMQVQLAPAILNNLVLVSLIWGIIGARITFIIYNWSSFVSPVASDGSYRSFIARLIDMLKINQGGLVFDGGVTLGFFAIMIYLWRHKLPVRRILDIMAIALMIGLSLGRIGCFMNGCCYGGVCDSHWVLGVEFPYSGEPVIYPHGENESPWPNDASPSLVYAHQAYNEQNLKVPRELLEQLPDGAVVLKSPSQLETPAEIEVAHSTHSLAVHPVQLYSSANALLLALLLYMIWRRRPTDGVVMSIMLIFYGITRFILEVIRDDNPDMAVTTAQIKCMVMVLGGIIAWIVIARNTDRKIAQSSH